MKKKRNLTLIIGAVLTAFYASVSSDRLFSTHRTVDGRNERRSQVCCSISVTSVRLRSLWTRYFQPRLKKEPGTTFFVAFATLLLGGTIGVLVGAFTGYFGGWIDEILMRINDVIVFLSGNQLVFIALLVPAIHGSCTRYRIHSELCTYHQKRISHAKIWTMSKSARLMGVSHLRIIFVHILPI